MGEALLLLAAQRIIGGEEVRYKNPRERGEQILQKASFARRLVEIIDLVDGCHHPDVAYLPVEICRSFIYMQQWSLENVAEDFVVKNLVIGFEIFLELVKLGIRN